MSPSELPLVLPLSDPTAIAATRVGPKAATLARLAAAGLPVPEGFSLTDEAYRRQLRAGGSEDTARGVAGADPDGARRQALAVRLGFLREPFDPPVGCSLTEA
ncbi:MAG TPA: hypothetical protein VFN71_00030, partial [Methylomirabilota bacterium]|nr:hypothetical protein [Methylomirabilota bacterium]